MNTRPYFLPEDLEFEALPSDLRIAIEEIIVPAYQLLVLETFDPLERASGASFVGALTLELFEQFALRDQLSAHAAQRGEAPDANRYLRALSAKEKAGAFLLKVRSWRARHVEPLPSTPRPR